MQCTISAGAGTPTTATLLQVRRRLVGYRADRRHAGLGLTSTLPPGESTPLRAGGLLAFGIGSEAGPTRASDPTRRRCRGPGRLRSRQSRWPRRRAPSWHLGPVRERYDRERWSLRRYPPPSAGSPSRTASTNESSPSGRDPGCVDVSAPAAVEAAEDQRHAVTYPSGEGDGAAALHGVRRSRRRPFG